VSVIRLGRADGRLGRNGERSVVDCKSDHAAI
jgi:hypothetical protein